MSDYSHRKKECRRYQLTLLIFCLLVTGSCLQGCSDDDDPQPPTLESLLAGEESKAWTIESYTVLGFIQLPEECASDDELVFFRNQSLSYITHEMKCEEDELPAIAGTWELDESKEFLMISAGPLAGKASIEDLTQDRLQVTTTELNIPVTVTFVAK